MDSELLDEPLYFAISSGPGDLLAVYRAETTGDAAYCQSHPERYRPMTTEEYNEIERKWREHMERGEAAGEEGAG